MVKVEVNPNVLIELGDANGSPRTTTDDHKIHLQLHFSKGKINLEHLFAQQQLGVSVKTV